VEFTEHRAYQPGDELALLDWRMLGRSDRLFVKQFEEETLRSMILVDASRRWPGTGRRSGSPSARTPTASRRAWRSSCCASGTATGLVTFDGAGAPSDSARVKTGNGRASSRLARHPDGQGPRLRRVGSGFTGCSLDAAWSCGVRFVVRTATLLSRAALLRHRGHQVIVFHLMNPAEIQLTVRRSTLPAILNRL